jgi:hypothetical protein
MGTNNRVLRNIIREISEETGLDENLIEKMNNSQFKYVRDVMAKGDKENPETYKTVYLQYIGRFVVKPHMVKRLEENRDGGTEDSE